MKEKEIPIKGHDTDQELIQKVKAGNEQAYRSIFDKYYEVLVRQALMYLKDLNPAKDVVQDVFLELWKNKERLTISQSLKAYLKRSVTNRCLNHIKSQKLHGGKSDILPFHRSSKENNPLQHSEYNELKNFVHQIIDQLPDRCQLIFKLCRIDGYSHKEIAEQLDISTKTVENQMTKALKILRDNVLSYMKEGGHLSILVFLAILNKYMEATIGVLGI